MADEAIIRLRLDTSQAKRDLAELVNEASEASRGAAKSHRSAIGRGLNAAGLGVAFGAGMEAIRGATASGVGDVVGEALGGFGVQLEQMFLGSLGQDARASMAAREETISALGAVAGAQNKIPPGAKSFFDSVKSLTFLEQRGRTLFEMNDDFRGPGIGDIVDRVMQGFAELISKAVDALADKLNPFK